MEPTKTDTAAVPLDGGESRELHRLIENLPLAVIASDVQGRIVRCNRRASQILKYEPAELAYHPAETIYGEPQESARIEKQLHDSPHGRLHNYETVVRTREGELIPILAAASWLHDEGGARVGSVTYFEDLRATKEAERRISTLLKENNLVSQTGEVEKTLHIWAELMVILLNTTFCRIFLLDQTEQFLVAKAAYPIARAAERMEWEPGLGERTAVAEWPRMIEFIKSGSAKVLQVERRGARVLLEEWSRRLGLKNGIQSMLIVPLRTKNRLLGLIDLGEVRSTHRSSFSWERQELATAIANQIAVSLDHAHLYGITERHRSLLETLVEKSLQLRSDLDPPMLLAYFVRDAANLVGFSAAGFFSDDPQSKELVLDVVHQLPQDLIGRRVGWGRGLVGRAALRKRPLVKRGYSTWGPREDVFAAQGFETAVAIPLRDADQLDGVLFLAADAAKSQLADGDLEVLEQFAAHAGLAWRTSRLMHSEQQRLARLINLSDMSGYIESSKDVNTILRVLLTGITAGYALGFNRAAALLLDETRTQLVGRAGVGYLKETDAHQDWEKLYHRGLDNFSEFLRLLEQKALPPTPVDERVRGLLIPLNSGEENNLFSRAINLQTHYILNEPARLAELPAAFREALEPAAPAAIVPLVARGEVLGLLFADTKFTKAPITSEVVESLLRFVNTVALNVQNVALLDQTPARAAGPERIRELMTRQAEPESPRQVLQYVVEQTLDVTGASWVRLILIDPQGNKRSRIDWVAKAAQDREIPHISVLRPDGISMRVIDQGRPVLVEDTEKHAKLVSSTALHEGSRAFACLPFYVQGQIVGVVWIHYAAPRQFNGFEVGNWQRYLNFAAGLYADASRRKRLNNLSRLHAAAAALAATTTPQAVLDQIVRSTRNVLRADYIIPWLYDPEQNRFAPVRSTVARIPEELWREWRRHIPLPGGTADTIMRAGWVGVEDINDPEDSQQLQATTRQLVRSPLIGASSFQGVSLAAGREKLGVLYAIYKEPQFFAEDDRETATAFANHVTLALKKAQVMEQLTRVNEAARTVAKVSVLGDKKRALKSIAKQVIRVVGCDAVVLFVYDKATAKLEHPPTMMWVKNKKQASADDEVRRDSIVYDMLRRRSPYRAENVPADPLFKGKRFAAHEGIKACLAVPLWVEGQGDGDAASEVGVIFINYRKPHRFTDGELEIIELFANQAAIAIHNMQLYEDRVRRLSEQEALFDLSGEMLSTNDSLKTLRRAVAVGAEQLGVEFCSIILRDSTGRPTIRASKGFTRGLEGLVVTEHEAGGDLWATLTDGIPSVIDDYRERGAFPPLVAQYGITSGACVPVYQGGEPTGKIIGALVVQTRAPKPRHFSQPELAFLRLLANQTAIAYQSAVRFEKVERSRAYLRALYKVSNALNTCYGPGMDYRRVLTPIVQAARYVTSIDGPPAVLATIHTYDPEANTIELQSVFPLEEYDRLRGRFGPQFPVDRERAPDGKIGIIGRVIEEGVEQLVPDVRQEQDDYLDFHHNTRSELAVPLLDQGGRVVGVLNVESNQTDAFNEDDVEAMKALAELAVIGLENVKTYNAWQQGTRVLDTFTRIGKTINDVNLDLKATLKAVLKSIKEDSLIEYTAAEVCRGDVNKGVAEVIESYGDPRYSDQAKRLYQMGEGYTGWIAKNQCPLLILDTAACKEPMPKVHDQRLPIRSFVGVPLRINEREFGTLELVSHIPNAFEKWHLYLLECVRDLTEVAIRNAEQAKELQSEAYVAGLGAWGAEVAHYVNTEVGLIKLILHRLRNRPDLPGDVKEDLRLAQTYADALYFTREQDASAVAEFDAVVSEAVDQVEREWGQLTWRRDLNAAGHKVKISAWGLRDLTTHLLKNAAKYSPPEKIVREVRVRTWCDDGRAYLWVEDTGNGFPKEIEPVVFYQPIKRAGGDGTGLMLVRSMVKRYGGTVALYNVPGEGARVEVCLHLDAGA
jgi:PAS domain S-box-containing protein